MTDPRPQANEASSSISGADAHQMHLILALVLLQTIGLFQRERGGPAPENIQQHHAMLVMVSISFFSCTASAVYFGVDGNRVLAYR